MFQDDEDGVRSTAAAEAASCVYGAPPIGRNVPNGWQKTGE